MDIGFDFGTTNCSIGWTKPDGSEVVRGPWPSEVVWHNGQFFFGRDARELRDETDQEVRVIRDVKLLLHGDSAVTNDRPFTAIDAAAALMRHVIGAAVTEDIDQAVIATPIRVAREQRIRTKLAAERAGAKSIRYSSASLRERLYFPKDAGNELHLGLLIYTASQSSDGTLGGLVRQAQPNRLGPMVLGCLASAAWCTSDPLCIESTGQGVDALNLAACHACALVSETSCEHFNTYLDRSLVVGHAGKLNLGYFEPLLAKL